MKANKVILAMAVLSVLGGCGILTDRKQVDYQSGAAKAPALEVPPDLISQSAEPRYVIPSADGTQVAKYSDFARDTTASAAQPVAGSAVMSATATLPAPRLLEAGGVRFMLLEEPFDRSWRKVGLALERAGIATSDVDRSKGVYFIKGESKGRKAVGDLRLLVHESTGVSLVTVEQDAAKNAAEVDRILELLYQHIEK